MEPPFFPGSHQSQKKEYRETFENTGLAGFSLSVGQCLKKMEEVQRLLDTPPERIPEADC